MLFELADLSQVWVEARLPVATLAELTLDDPVRVVAKNLGLDVTARLSYVDPRIDAGTQTALARAVVSTADAGAALRPGLFVELHGATAARERAITVPARAVTSADGGRFVFVRVEGRGHGAAAWEAREVELGQEGDELVEIRSGLRAGETVATSQLLLLKSVWLGQGGEE